MVAPQTQLGCGVVVLFCGLQVWKRQDIGKKEEQYDLLSTFQAEPKGKELNDVFQNKPEEIDPSKPWWANL